MKNINNKGQALVEFVLILPVLLLILLVVVDFGNLLYSKNKLENDSADIVRIIKNESNIELKNEYPDIKVKVEDYKDNYKKLTGKLAPMAYWEGDPYYPIEIIYE